MENQIIQVGIAGFGVSGAVFQAPFLDIHPNFCIRKVFERTTNRSKERYPAVEVVRSFENLLDGDIDLVVISTPVQFHYQMAKQAILAGKHVVVEKPATATSSEMRELISLAERNHVLFTAYQNRRWDGDFRTVCQLIKQGLLGKLVDYEAHFDRFSRNSNTKQWKEADEPGTGVHYDLGTHLIDQAVTLFGMPQSLYGDLRTQREGDVAPDHFTAMLYYADGLRVLLSASQTVRENGPHFSLHGTDGSFQKYGMDVQEERLKAGGVPSESGWGMDQPQNWGKLNTVMNGVHFNGKVETVPGSYGMFYDNIYQVLTNGAELEVKPQQICQVLQLIEAVIESSQSGKRVYFE